VVSHAFRFPRVVEGDEYESFSSLAAKIVLIITKLAISCAVVFIIIIINNHSVVKSHVANMRIAAYGARGCSSHG